jgi:hypothetical protein
MLADFFKNANQVEISGFMFIQPAALFLFAAISALAQTNDVVSTNYSIEISNWEPFAGFPPAFQRRSD